MSQDMLRYERRDGVGWVTIHRPEKLNTLTERFFAELAELTAHCREDAACRALVVTGAGARAFSAGADIGMFLVHARKPLGGKNLSALGQSAFRAFEELGKPSIAAIDGVAVGGGCEFALACTFRVGSERARLGLTETTVGIIPGWGGTQRLTRLVGRPRALEMILSGEILDAAECLRIGLLCRVVPSAELLGACEELARRVSRNGPLAVRLALEAVHQGMNLPQLEAERLEANLAGFALHTEDAREGVTAFLEKRKPEFKGR